ncbi:NADPH:quinone reductase [Rhizobium tibeticum]|uniref:NADPH:quinone reductase n=1 Tax=Rhizobium tibeticum TaxID=501024 RepID=A0A1H8H0Y3_9HYPH|nr:NADP-dependent oxidoreductase [Rhizobium tibeticum]SEH63672.1 Quinone oxidoreductase 1 [Rhizobium tibeticum]SEN49893.1 NADPH:quinone reductase [Rhizobium tibeticum]
MSDRPQHFSGEVWRIHEFGPPEVMMLEHITTSTPGTDEVIVRVHAAGVGPWDGWIRSGNSALPQPLPLILGSDISGEVVAMGSDVDHLAVGDQVYGVTNKRFCGGYAQYAAAKASMLDRKPPSIDYVAAASLPVIAVTAWQALFDQAGLMQGQTVLIHGAAGNVGAFAVQFAKSAGLNSICTASSEDIERVRSLGAGRVIDYKAALFEDEVHDVDAVMDFVGGESQTRSFKVLKRGGMLISAVSKPDQMLAERHEVTAGFFLVDVSTESLRRISDLLNENALEVNVGLTLPFEQARDAHLMLEGQLPQPKGKIVLVTDPA